MMKNEYWVVVASNGNLWYWTFSWERKESITKACTARLGPEFPRKSAWHKLKREHGCRIIKVKVTEISKQVAVGPER